MLKRISIFLLLLSAAFLLYWSLASTGNSPNGTGQGPSDDSIVPASPDPPLGLEREPAGRVFRFVDVLSGLPIPSERVYWAEDVQGVSHSSASLAAFATMVDEGLGYWEVEIGTDVLKIPNADVERREGEILLPLMSALLVTAVDLGTGETIEGASFRGAIIDQELFQEAAEKGDIEVIDAISVPGTLAFARRVFEAKVGGLEWFDLPLAGQTGSGELSFFEGARFLGVEVFHPDYGHGFLVSSLVPGLVERMEFGLRLRPVLRGSLLSADGAPLPFKTISLLVDLGQESESLGPEDGHFATVTYGEPGNWQRTARTDVRTNSQGEFSLRMPRGIQFAAEYGSDGGYGFSETEVYLIPPVEDVYLDVNVVGFDQGYVVQVVHEDGEPAQGVFVRPRIADDVPWFRQFVGVPVDQDGVVRLPMLAAGLANVRLIAQSGPDWTTSEKIATSPRITLPVQPFRFEIPSQD